MARPFTFAIVLSLLFSFCIPSVRAADPADVHPGINLIPWPKSFKVDPGFMKIDEQTRIIADDELKPLAEIFSQELALLTGQHAGVVSGPARAGDIVLHINKAIAADEPILVTRGTEVVKTTDGAHTIAIGDQAVLEGFDYRAVAEGSATLLQALSQQDGTFRFPKLTIKDWPRADYCAMMIDVGRQNHPAEILKKMVEVCRLYKVRYLHLHMTDDQGWTFPSTKYPQLGTKNMSVHGGVASKVYTLAELKDLVAFADARGIAIVPELEVPGHSGAALRSFPEVFDAINPATGQPVGMGCMNMSNEELYTVLDTVIGEMCDVFKSSPYFHIGSDEVSAGRVTLNPGYQAFMAKHNLKSENDLPIYFIRQVNEMVKKRRKKAIKWEGLANGASKDIIIMAWDAHSNVASELLAQGYNTITCPWNLEVPWEQWSMYVCNGSRLKKSDAVLGATLVAWEQSAESQLRGIRNVASRQERTWGPDNTPTVDGYAVRFQADDAVVGKLLQMPPQPRVSATFVEPAGTAGFQVPELALDGSDDSFHLAGRALRAGESFTVTLDQPALVYSVQAITGQNKHGFFSGELQIAGTDGTFNTVATFDQGRAEFKLKDNHIKAIRLLASADQPDPMVLHEVKLQLMTELPAQVDNPTKQIGEGNVGILKGDASFGPMFGNCDLPIVINGSTLRFDSGGGNALGYSGAIMGNGKVEFHMGAQASGFRNSAMTLSGKTPNPFDGIYYLKQGRVRLQKDDGVDAIAGDVIVGGQGDNDCLYWVNSNQIRDSVNITLLNSPQGSATINLNGCTDSFNSLTIGSQCKILTDGEKLGGVLAVNTLTVEGKAMPSGVYTSGAPWVQGSGFVIVGPVKYVEIDGTPDHPQKIIGENNIAVLKGPTSLNLTDPDWENPIKLNGTGLILNSAGSPVNFKGFITGTGSIAITAAHGADRAPLEFTGSSSNSFTGPTHVTTGVVKLNKAPGAIAIPGDLIIDGSKPGNKEDGVIFGGDGQITDKAGITLTGDQPSFLDLAGHQVRANKLMIGAAGKIRTGTGGKLTVHQIVRDGKPVIAGVYTSSEHWIEGSGSVTVDPKVDVKGTYSDPNGQIGAGNIGNLTADTRFVVGIGNCDIDIVTNNFKLTLDSGDGNPLCYTGAISGTGALELRMGPSRNNYKDAPLRLAGPKANTTTGKFIADKGRVQLEKPDGVDAISGDVIVGGQGFNDCLYWKQSNQIKDSANITMTDTPNSGAAYLNLNGCSETVQSLTMTANNKVETDGTDGKGGVLTVKSLTIAGKSIPAGTFTATTDKWIEGGGKVVVQP